MEEKQVTRSIINHLLEKEDNIYFDYIDPPKKTSGFMKNIRNSDNSSSFKSSYDGKVGGPDIKVSTENKNRIIESKGSSYLPHNFQTGLSQLFRYADNINSPSFEYSFAVPEEKFPKVRKRLEKNEGGLSECFEEILNLITDFESEWNIYLVSDYDVEKIGLKESLVQ